MLETPTNTFDLTPEQQHTLALLQRLFGTAIADRYTDFCRLAAGAFDLHVARPIAAHALRELDSMLRQVLEVPMDAKATHDQDNAEKVEKAKQDLIALGFDEAAIQRASSALKPRFSHKNQIRKIVTRLGLAPDGDVANCWTSLCDSFGKAHQRSFHHSLKVDEEFRTQYQQPFETVIRAVSVALQGRYVALMRRVEELAAMQNRAQAVALFANEIPGALPLQWHFFQRLQTGDWLPHLARERLLGEPLAGSHEGASEGMRFRQWPAGNYLLRMAESPDATTRNGVVEALRNVASSNHADIHHDGLEILAALPPGESAQLSDLAVGWLGREDRFSFLQAPEKLLKKLTEAQQEDAALTVARALLQIWDNNGEIASLYGHHMYEHHLPSIIAPLAKACGEDAVRLFVELLQQAALISGRDSYSYHSSYPIADDERAQHDIHDALLSAVRRSADTLVADNPAQMRAVIGILSGETSKIFIRIALHVLSRNPAAAPELAEAYLLNPELIEASWCQIEYASLALVWFPSLAPDKQQVVLAVVDSLPDKYRASWRARFEEHTKALPTAENERIFNAATIRDALWRWRKVLPLERLETIDKIARELGDPDAWKQRLFPEEVSPLTGADFSSQAITDIVAFLKSWHPDPGPQRQTVTALAQEFRAAVGNDPKGYAASADQFIGLKPIYIRRVLEGLQNATSNGQSFEWGNVLKLIEHVFRQLHQAIDPAAVAEGDDKDWIWACKTASETLASGLRRGAGGIGFEHAAAIRSLVPSLVSIVPKQPEFEDFESRFKREPFFAAQATLRGLAVELCVLLVFWLSKDTSNAIGASPQEALVNFPEIRNILEAELADRSPSGRVPRAIMGRYLNHLCYFGEDWLKSQMGLLFPTGDSGLRQSAWLSHLGFGQGPNMYLISDLHQCYAEEIARSVAGDEQSDRDFRQDSLSQHLIILHLWGGLPDDLLEQFWRDAPLRVRQHAMWYLGTQLDLSTTDLPDEMRARGFSYWERRLAAAQSAADSEPFRLELGAIGQWCLRAQIDDQWLMDQLISMLRAGFLPTDAFSVVERLQKISPDHSDQAVTVLSELLRNPRVDRWAYITQRDPNTCHIECRYGQRRHRNHRAGGRADWIPLNDRRDILSRSHPFARCRITAIHSFDISPPSRPTGGGGSRSSRARGIRGRANLPNPDNLFPHAHQRPSDFF
jgi:hypothetical protein